MSTGFAGVRQDRSARTEGSGRESGHIVSACRWQLQGLVTGTEAASLVSLVYVPRERVWLSEAQRCANA